MNKPFHQAQEHNAFLLPLGLLLSGAIFAADSFLPLGVAGGVPYILVVLMALWSKNIRFPLLLASVGTAMTILGFFTSPEGGAVWTAIVNRGLSILGVWAAAFVICQRMFIEREKERALSEVRTLSGLLPICASCKKVRDDDGYWGQLDLYIREHTEADFSHGICPQCASELYPEIFNNQSE